MASTNDGLMPAFFVCHHDFARSFVTPETLELAEQANYDALTVRITNNIFHSRVKDLFRKDQPYSNLSHTAAASLPVVPALSPSDTHLGPGKIVPKLLGIVSPWIDLCSLDPIIYNVSRQVLQMEVSFAAFCGLNALVLPAPRLHHGAANGHGISQYAHAIQEVLQIGLYIQFSVTLPMWDDPAHLEEPEGSLASFASLKSIGAEEKAPRASTDSRSRHDFFGTWDAWNVIRSLCNYHFRLMVGLQIPRLLPPSSVCSRWQSEPLRILFIDSSTYFVNPQGFPVLTANHRALIDQYMRHTNPPCIVLSGAHPVPGTIITRPDDPDAIVSSAIRDGNVASTDAGEAPTPAEAQAGKFEHKANKSWESKDPLAHLRYLRWFQINRPPKSYEEIFGADYQDFLQSPLQPLTDNLESNTYEVFEKDPVKYDQYETAICKALEDWRSQGKPPSGHDQHVVIAVVGAGRGPLVTRAREASKSANVPIELWALEKNPNAFVLLQRHNSMSWDNEVKLVKSDMRSWKGPVRFSNKDSNWSTNNAKVGVSPILHYPIDIVVSELLGSFGDNELSPECLDGVLPLLNPTHGISIPHSYTAHITPIAAPKLHADILAKAANDPSAHSTPYVVLLHSFDYLANSAHRSAYGLDVESSLTSDDRRSSSTGATKTASTLPEDEKTPFTKPPLPTVLQAWAFNHDPTSTISRASDNTHNVRHTRLSFSIRHRAACHGLAGYFEATLYPGVEISTNPMNQSEKSPLMMSWFPIFFPLKTPLYTPDHSTLTVSMYRATDGRKVWYEWMVEAWSNNPASAAASGFRLGVSELGSTKEKACMM